jgi:hypothetical protein
VFLLVSPVPSASNYAKIGLKFEWQAQERAASPRSVRSSPRSPSPKQSPKRSVAGFHIFFVSLFFVLLFAHFLAIFSVICCFSLIFARFFWGQTDEELCKEDTEGEDSVTEMTSS